MHPWSGYRKCLTDPPDCTHLLIVQDDAVACTNIAAGLLEVARVEPNFPICLFLPMITMRTKRQALLDARDGKRFTEIFKGDFMPVVAMLWPIGKSQEFLEWSSSHLQGVSRRGLDLDQSDDAMGCRWMKSTRNRVLATIPCLFQHYDDVPSTIARNPCGRTAMFWHGDDWDCCSVSWG